MFAKLFVVLSVAVALAQAGYAPVAYSAPLAAPVAYTAPALGYARAVPQAIAPYAATANLVTRNAYGYAAPLAYSAPLAAYSTPLAYNAPLAYAAHPAAPLAYTAPALLK